MKKILLLSLALTFGLVVIAQQRVTVSKALRNYPVKTTYEKPVKDLGAVNSHITGAKAPNMFTDEIMGKTQYDLQTNKAVANRLYLHSDGTLGATWNMGFDPTGFALRGTGYNYFDGTAWGPIPTERVEDTKTGFPSYVPFGQNGEIFVAHHMTDGLYYSKRDNKGTGDWTFGLQAGPAGAVDISWPRMVTTGANHDIIHFFSVTYTTYMGQENCPIYSRSSDGGQTWEINNLVLDGLGSAYYFNLSADIYAFAEPRAGQMALLVGDNWMDLVMLKSEDDGDTWDKTIIWEHPYPFFDFNTTITDTFYCNDGSIAIALDSEGKAHVTFGISRVLHDAAGTTYTYFPYVDGVAYWNEDMPTFGNDVHALDPYGHPNSQLQEDYNLIGWTQDVNNNGTIDFVDMPLAYRSIGVSTMTNISIDDIDRILMAYSSTTETYETGTLNYKHVWLRGSPDGGVTWGDFLDLDADVVHIFDECIYPNISPTSDGNNFYLFYQTDATPGLALDGDHPYQENNMYFVTLPKDEIIGTGEPQKAAEVFSVTTNYPNPARGVTTFYVKLEQPATLQVNILNAVGKTVQVLPSAKYADGSHRFDINTEQLPAGVYFYSVTAGDQTITRKMLVQ
jgi:hypothetical protein